jgi:pimeloyl-ACP methyl ester carboxylesterase
MELTVPVPGGEVWAEDTGGDGAPLVLVHGDWTDSRVWTPLTGLLRGRYRIIRYDLRGFGRSPTPEAPFSRLDDLRAVLDHLGVDRAAIVSHSGAGGPALGLALADSARVTALVLVAPGVHDYPWPRDDPYMQEVARLIEEKDREGLVALGLRTWAPAGADEEIRDQFNGAVSSWFANGDLERPDPAVFDRLGEVHAPAIALVGDFEYPMVVYSSDAIARRIDGCRLLMVPGADHLLPLRVPARLAEVIDETVPG